MSHSQDDSRCFTLIDVRFHTRQMVTGFQISQNKVSKINKSIYIIIEKKREIIPVTHILATVFNISLRCSH